MAAKGVVAAMKVMVDKANSSYTFCVAQNTWFHLEVGTLQQEKVNLDVIMD